MAEKTCPMIPLPDKFNFWKVTPLHNIIQFASNKKKKIMVCPTNRSVIADDFGIINLPPRCFIQTDTDIIRVSLDESKSTKLMAKISFDNIISLLQFPVITEQSIENSTDMVIKERFNPDDSDLNEVIREAENISNGLSWWHLVLIVINVWFVIGIIAWASMWGIKRYDANEIRRDYSVKFNKNNNDFEEIPMSAVLKTIENGPPTLPTRNVSTFDNTGRVSESLLPKVKITPFIDES